MFTGNLRFREVTDAKQCGYQFLRWCTIGHNFCVHLEWKTTTRSMRPPVFCVFTKCHEAHSAGGLRALKFSRSDGNRTLWEHIRRLRILRFHKVTQTLIDELLNY